VGILVDLYESVYFNACAFVGIILGQSRTIYSRQINPLEATQYMKLRVEIMFFKIKFTKCFKSINMIYLDYKYLLFVPKLTAMY